ncbi:MAG TPA: hypothetical protein VFV58_39445 [Blastocatellia bacterium]|nr:hypothetical protein [Blastocatellia bacterium]
MKFRDLEIGATFEFDHSVLECTCYNFAHGPWVKVSPRKYQWLAGGSEIKVGRINVAVRPGEDCGRRPVFRVR